MNCAASKPVEPKADDTILYLFALIGAFMAGVMVVLIFALGARVDSLKDQLQRERENPRVVVVERTVGHE